MNIEIESQDVIKLILQFLKENNLIESMKTLQKESFVTLNTVDNIEYFANDIRNGRWDSVLAQTSVLKLPTDKLSQLYEQVVLELLEVGERDLAKELLHSSEPLIQLKHDQPERFSLLETFSKRPFFNPSDVYDIGSSKERRRQELAESLMIEVSVVQPSRLLALLGQSIKYQQSQNLLPAPGVPFDLFRCARKTAHKDVEEKVPKKLEGEITLTKGSPIESLLFSPDGQSLVTGSSDGFVEAWDFEAKKLRQDLDYQAKGEFMVQEGPVTCCTFSKDSDHLATGSQTGQIKVWKLSSGVCLRKFMQAHPQGITSLTFARDGTQILSTSFDQTARMHGLKSGKTLKEFRGHTSFVNCAIYGKDANVNNILTGSSDGTIKLWDIRSTECQLTYRPGMIAGVPVSKETAVVSILQINSAQDQIIAVTRNCQAYLMTINGQIIRSFSSGKQVGGDFQCATLSPQGRWLYCVGEDGILYIFDVKNGQLETFLEIASNSTSRRDVTGISHHPHRNLIATIGKDGIVKLWRP
eukprot:gene11992-16055_t